MEHLIKISSAGEHLPIDAEQWDAVLDTETNLMWSRHESEKEMPHAEAEKHCAALVVGGFNDWRWPNRKELLSIVDDTRFNPAIDIRFFNSHSDWCWSSSPIASSPSDFAWIVYFHGGYSGCSGRDFKARFRAVRSASPAVASQ